MNHNTSLVVLSRVSQCREVLLNKLIVGAHVNFHLGESVSKATPSKPFNLLQIASNLLLNVLIINCRVEVELSENYYINNSSKT